MQFRSNAMMIQTRKHEKNQKTEERMRVRECKKQIKCQSEAGNRMKCAVTHKVFLLARFVCWCIQMDAVAYKAIYSSHLGG